MQSRIRSFERHPTEFFMIKKHLTFLLFLTLFSVQASAQQWVILGKDTRGEEFFVNTKLVDYDGTDWFGAWVKFKKTEYATIKGKKTALRRDVKQLFYIKCSSNEMAAVQTVVYNSRGEVVKNWKEDYPDFTAVVPESMGEAIARGACQLKEGLVDEKIPD